MKIRNVIVCSTFHTKFFWLYLGAFQIHGERLFPTEAEVQVRHPRVSTLLCVYALFGKTATEETTFKIGKGEQRQGFANFKS